MGGTTRNKVAKVISGALTGYNGSLVEVETDIKAGLPSLQIVGLGNKAIDEARQRVRSAITNSQLEFPAQKKTVNLAPAELPKDGTHLDLPIALSILVASGQLQKTEVENALFVGELALDGSIRPIRGAVVLAELAKMLGQKRLILPHQNVFQARLVSNLEIIGVSNLQQLYQGLKGVKDFADFNQIDDFDHFDDSSGAVSAKDAAPSVGARINARGAPSLFDTIIGHEQAKRALVIAAAGRHNLLFCGPPGAGKTLLAKSLLDILPPLTKSEILEVTKLHSLAEIGDGKITTSPSFRAPHHTVTLTALIGGGLRPRPGDISLAHKGVLFLDELPEYPRSTLEALRQPLEDRTVSLSRLFGRITYPADVLFIATMNPCPCGYAGDTTKQCICPQSKIDSYQHRISGPLLDRIDLKITVAKANNEHFFDSEVMQNSHRLKVLNQVVLARKAQAERYKRRHIYNAHASAEDIKKSFQITQSARAMLDMANKKMALSSRSYLKVLRVARTIADIEQSAQLDAPHVAEALQFR